MARLIGAVSALFPAVPESRIFGISCHEAEQGLLSPGMPGGHSDPGNIQGFLRGLISTFEQIASPTGIDGDKNGEYDISYWEDSLGVTHRQSSNLQRCMQHLEDFLSQTQLRSSKPETPNHAVYENGNIESDVDIVTAAEHLRFAADTLARITGKGESGDVEDVLGVVFEK